MKVSITQLLVAVTCLSILLTMVSSLYAGYRADQESLERLSLETNQNYALKLAQSTEDYLQRTEHALSFSSELLEEAVAANDGEEMNEEAERLVSQTNSLSSSVVTDQNGIIRGASKKIQQLIGRPLSAGVGVETLSEGITSMTLPYYSQMGNLVVFISAPVHDGQGRIIGLIGGTIYLKEKNGLSELLGRHFHENDSYVYVIDPNGMLIYHPDRTRVGDYISDNPINNALKLNDSGSGRWINSQGEDVLAGYAKIPYTDWGIVSQTYTDKALSYSKRMVYEMILKSLPFILLSAVLIFYFASRISKPLERLARYATDQLQGEERIELKSGAWYREAIQLDLALTDSFNRFQQRVDHFIMESSTDPLTSLLNRRALTEKAHEFSEQNTPYSLVIFDIDKFKRINDTYGHSAGDEVLKFLAAKMREFSGEQGLCYRFGGEEFVILLPETSYELATRFADGLRLAVSSTDSPVGERITFSAGVAELPYHAEHFLRLLELADDCLYLAKETGRNQVIHANQLPRSE